jgi:catechol-2,3-dioxygenase
MKRFHIHVGVENLEKSVQFYSTLFGQKPTKLKEDYAKWMLEDPRLNFAISTRTNDKGVDHLGIQVETPPELSELTERLKNADLAIQDEGETTCCYSNSNKAWVEDPSGIAWETYQNMGDVEVFSGKKAGEVGCC